MRADRDAAREWARLRLLDELEARPRTSQRALAARLGIALGAVNRHLRELVAEGWLRVLEPGVRPFAYALTPAGARYGRRLRLRYCGRVVGGLREAEARIADRLARLRLRGARRLVFYGAGELAELAWPVARWLGFEVAGLVDDDPARWGARRWGLPVRPPDAIEALPPDAVVLTGERGARSADRRLRARRAARTPPLRPLRCRSTSTAARTAATHEAQGPMRPTAEDRASAAGARMREDWNERARAAAFHYILSEREFRDPEEFFRTGEEDYETLVAPVLRRLGFDPSGGVAVDVGCGAGRITRALARRFGHVYGVDVSDEMLKVASRFSRDLTNVTWLRSDGASLGPLEAGSADFVFSYLVLQHVPRRELALALVADMIRVLRPDGVFLFQFISDNRGDMNWRGRTLWWVMDGLRSGRRGSLRDALGVRVARLVGLDARKAGPTWHGTLLQVQEVLGTLWNSGAAVAGVLGWGTKRTWCYGRKLASASFD